MELQPAVASDDLSRLHLWAEYSEWCRTPAAQRKGIYVAPAASGRNWEGLIFVRDGPYEGAVFGFQLEIAAEYPAQLPRIRFITPAERPRGGRVVHPRVKDDILEYTPQFEEKLTQPTTKFKCVEVLHYLRDTFEGTNLPSGSREHRHASACAARAAELADRDELGLPHGFAVQLSLFYDEVHGATRQKIITEFADDSATPSGTPSINDPAFSPSLNLSGSAFFSRLLIQRPSG